MTNWDKILVDFAHKCGDGGPDMTNPRHLALLRESLIKFGWKENAANEILGNLREGTKHGDYLKSLPEQPWGKEGGSVKVSTALGWRNYKGKGEYQRPGYKLALQFLGGQKDKRAKEVLGSHGYYVDADGVIRKSEKLSQFVTQKGKPKEKEKSEKIKGGDPVRATDDFDRKKEQVTANANKAREAVVKKKKALKEARASGNKEKIAKAEKALATAKKKKEAAEYSEKQFKKIEKAIQSGDPKQIQEAIDESLRRVREDGVAQPGGIAASNGESSCCNAANKLSKKYDQNKIGSTKDHTGTTVTEQEQQNAFDDETTGRRIEHAIELGLVELCEKGTDGCPDGYKPDPMNLKTQKLIGLELEKRRRFVEAERAEILKGDSEIAEDIRAAEKKKNKACKVTKSKAQKKACRTATNGLKTKENNLKEWLETGYDTGRAMLDDIVHDRGENCEWEDGKLVDEDCKGDYNAPVGFPNDPVNEEHGTPDSAIMSPETQALFRGQLERERKKCEELKDSTKKGGGERYEKCATHYDDQLKNFDEGVSDHDTGMMYYDADDNLRFVNVSNKKTKDTGKGESKKGKGDEDRNEVAGGIDPQYNGTPAGRTKAVMKAIDIMIDENKTRDEFGNPLREPEFPDFDGSLGRQVGSALVKGYKKAFDLAQDASTNVTTLQIADGQPATMVGVSNGQPSSDAGVMATLTQKLPPKGKEGVYYDNLADRQEVKDKCKKLFPDSEEPYDEDEVIAAAIELMKDPSQDLPYDPFGKIVEKYGEVYNDIEDKIKNKGWTKEEIAEKYGISVEQVDAILNSTAMQECGALKTRRQNSMEEAHREIVNATKKQDEEWFKTEEGKVWREKNPDANGPYTQTYVREYMNNMHWDKYIKNLDGKKQLQIGGVNCKPRDLRECLGELSGFKGDTSTPEGRAELLEHLERRVDIDADTGAVRVNGEGGASLGYDTWRTAGTSPKTAAGPGKDLRECLRKKNNTRQSNRRKK